MASRQASKPASQRESRPTSPPAQPAVPRPPPPPIPPPIPRPVPPLAPLPAPAPAAGPGGSLAPKPTAAVPNTAMAGAHTTGMPAARMPVAGMPVAGMPVAGMPVAGMPVAGMPVAGMPVAGMPVAGKPVAGSYMDALRAPYVQMPTPGLAPPAVPNIPGCPRGLEYLVQIDHLLVHQAIAIMEMVTSWEMQNKYIVKNTMGQFVFTAIEESRCLQRLIFGHIRSFEMSLLDYRNDQVLRLFRPFRCDCNRLCCCCFQARIYRPTYTARLEFDRTNSAYAVRKLVPLRTHNVLSNSVMDVRDASMALMGSLRREFGIVFPNFSVLDSQGNVVLLIKGPFCTISICCQDVVFDILATDGVTKLGAITKNWTGLCTEAVTDADNFTVTFPLDLDVKIKAVLLGAVFLIDYIYFESTQRRDCKEPYRHLDW
ncbi:phospholipid scramblase 2-like [Dermacentor variabilis]|uniref:phospholipid scramblase 2-like n=1 Tax=Dermacentor variabilis TaxID=34621 RepID=UPI003F5C2312